MDATSTKILIYIRKTIRPKLSDAQAIWLDFIGFIV